MKYVICNVKNNERIKIVHGKEEGDQITCAICKEDIKTN